MKRAVQRALTVTGVIVVAFISMLFSPSAAFAADSFTIDQPSGPVVLSPDGEVNFTGTVSPADDSDLDILLFIDGHFLTCGDDYSNDINAIQCYRTWANEGSLWGFAVAADEVERFGLEFLGPHEVRFVLTRFAEGTNKTIQAEKTVAFEFVTSLAAVTPSPEPDAALPESPQMPLASGTASELASGKPASRSVLSSVRPVTEVITNPGNVVITAAVTVILLLLVGLPSALLGQTLAENYDRLFGPVRSVLRRVARNIPARIRGSRSLPGWLSIAVGLTLATVMSAFVDPGFGWNLGSARMLLSMGAAFVLESVAGWMVIRAVLKRTDPDLNPKPEFKFGSLLIILVAVILSRIVGFEPGMIFGLVVGLTFGATLASARDARVKLIGLGWAFSIGVAGWLGYSLLFGVPGWLPLFGAETLSAVAVSSLAALPVALLPLAGLDGGVLFRWNHWAWAGVYVVAMLVFFVILMPMPFSWGEITTPLATWVGLYVAYAVVAIAVWGWLHDRDPQG